MFTGDVSACMQELDTLADAGERGTVDEIQKMLLKFTSTASIPVEDAEKLLTGVGNLMCGSSVEEVLVQFAANADFVGVLTTIVCDYARIISPPSPGKPISRTSFSSHCCYELSLFMLLPLVNTTRILKIFMRSTAPTDIRRLIEGICSVIQADDLHLTQVLRFLFLGVL